MKKLKNGFFDIVFFFLYHTFFFVGTCLLVLTLSYEVNLLDIDSLKKVLFTTSKSEASLVIKEMVKPKIANIRGDVFISEVKSEERQAVEGEVLIENTTVITKNSSYAHIVFGERYQCQINISSNSTLNIDDLQKKNQPSGPENSLFGLIKGAVQVMVTNKKQPVKIEFKTKHGVLGVRGTKFSVLTDNSAQTVLVVQEGKVEVENFISFTKKIIPAGTSVIIFSDGTEREFQSNELLDLFDWDMNNTEWAIPTLERVLSSLDNPVSDNETKEPSVDSNVPVSSAANEIVLKEIEDFKSYLNDLNDKLLNVNEFLAQTSANHTVEQTQIQNDILCLTRGKSQCNLYSEQILTLRGFPRTFGSPRLLASLIADLELYLSEKEFEIKSALEDKSRLELLIKNRLEVLSVVEDDLKSGKASEVIIPKLKDVSLIDKQN